MPRDEERIARVRRALEAERLDAVVCTLASNVLLVSGYWPVIGNAIAVATKDGLVAVLAPEDETRFVAEGWADTVGAFAGGSLDAIRSVIEIVERPFADVIRALGLGSARVGVEGAGAFDPSSYAARFSYGSSIEHLVRSASPDIEIRDA